MKSDTWGNKKHIALFQCISDVGALKIMMLLYCQVIRQAFVIWYGNMDLQYICEKHYNELTRVQHMVIHLVPWSLPWSCTSACFWGGMAAIKMADHLNFHVQWWGQRIDNKYIDTCNKLMMETPSHCLQVDIESITRSFNKKVRYARTVFGTRDFHS